MARARRTEESLMGRGRGGGPRPESAGGRVRIHLHLHMGSLPARWCLSRFSWGRGDSRRSTSVDGMGSEMRGDSGLCVYHTAPNAG
jgi:hypothetical protein